MIACFFQAIGKLRDKMGTDNTRETYRITMDDIIQATIFDIGFQYDKAGNQL